MNDKELKNLDNKIDSLQKDVTILLFMMQNDPATGEPGVMERVRTIEGKVSSLLTREQVYKAKGTVWGIIGGALATVIFWAGKMLITKFI